mgnify:CR=1 FL=1
MTDNDKNMEVVECKHCGNETLMELITNHQITKEYPIKNKVGITQYYFEEEYTWNLYYCPVCNKVNLKKIYWNDQMAPPGHGNNTIQKEYLYPKLSYKNSGVPTKINDSFKAALKAKNVEPSICLISLRRTLEMICKDKQFTKGTLYKKLKEMSQQNIIPPLLDEASHILRILGNEAAHGDDANHTKKQAEEMIEFTKYIIDYVYVIPHKISKIQNQMKD